MSKQFSVSQRLLASGAVLLIGIGGGFGLNAVVAGGTTTPVTYYGCVIASSGTISDVTTTGTPPTCPPNSTLISWTSQGTPGTNGTSVVTSSGVPSSPCTTGNTDIDLADGEVYTCTASAWVDTGKSIKGTNGTNGTNGNSVVTSSGVPTGPCTTGNTDIDLANGEVYSCISSAWSDTGSSIKGTNGTNGTSVLTSSGAPSNPCTTGNTDIDLANGEVYTCTASAWVDTGNTIKGTNGTNGTNGAGIQYLATTGEVENMEPGIPLFMPIVGTGAEGFGYEVAEPFSTSDTLSDLQVQFVEEPPGVLTPTTIEVTLYVAPPAVPPSVSLAIPTVLSCAVVVPFIFVPPAAYTCSNGTATVPVVAGDTAFLEINPSTAIFGPLSISTSIAG